MNMSYIRSLHNKFGWETNELTEGKINLSSGIVSFLKRCLIILKTAIWIPSSLQENIKYYELVNIDNFLFSEILLNQNKVVAP